MNQPPIIQQSLTISTLIHYSNISHATPVPALQLKYLEKLQHHSKDKGIPNPKKSNENFCSSCNLLLIPGFNVSIRIVFLKKKPNKKTNEKRVRILRYKCLSCNHNNDHNNILHNHSIPNEINQEEKKNFKLEWVPPSEKLKQQETETKSAKKRSQKRKNLNDLNLMLNNKKKNDQQGKKLSLDLMDFMK